MDRNSIRLALTGVLIGAVALTAALAAGRKPAGEERAPDPAAVLREDTEEAAPVLATAAPAGSGDESPGEAGPYLVALRAEDPEPGERLYLCDAAGCPLEEILPDRDGDAALGPLAPGSYQVCREQTQVGAFRLQDNAALTGAEGRLWTDGELLHLERGLTGAARLWVSLPAPGYYALRLCDRNGRSWSRDLYIPADAVPGTEGRFLRAVDFAGLPPGPYTVCRLRTVLGQLEVRAGEAAELELRIDK